MEENRSCHSVRYFLSERMYRTASFVTKGNRTADIGCDHAYTSIYLAAAGIAPKLIAMDVNAGPLKRAAENVKRFGVQEQIELRLSNGLEKLLPGEADTLLMAGMGGPLMMEILDRKPEVVRTVRELVLQPQSELSKVRRYLHREHFQIVDEEMLCEDGKYYTILHALPGDEAAWSETEYCYGKRLLQQCSPVLAEFLQREKGKLEGLVAELGPVDTEKSIRRRRELEEKLEQIRLALEGMERKNEGGFLWRQ